MTRLSILQLDPQTIGTPSKQTSVTFQEWELAWDMEFNPSKCQVLHITRLKHPLNTQYSLHGQVLEATDAAKYLGVSIAKDLSWNDHISSITAKANRTLGFVKRNVRTNNEKVKELAYKKLVRPQVEYASPVWSPTQSIT